MKTGLELVAKYLTNLGIGPDEFRLDDGSGLSRENRLSAGTLTQVLRSVCTGKDRQLFVQSLSAGGVDGTIAKYFDESKYKGKVFGKTGYIAGVKSFSGLCQTPKGDYIFSILTSGANGETRAAINDIVKAIIDNCSE